MVEEVKGLFNLLTANEYLKAEVEKEKATTTIDTALGNTVTS